MEKQFYTYLHCKPNGEPFYVGKGSGKRAFDFSIRTKFHSGIVSRYGRNNIQVYVFFCETEKQAFADEKQQIAQLRTEGYKLANLTDGGEGSSGYKLSLAAREKMSKSRKGNTNSLGFKHSEETKRKVSAAIRGRVHSEETKKKIAEAMMGNKYSLGYKHSPESVLRSSSSHIGKKRSAETRRRISEANSGKTRLCEKTTCPHCGLIGAANLLTRYPFNNCKTLKKDINVPD